MQPFPGFDIRAEHGGFDLPQIFRRGFRVFQIIADHIGFQRDVEARDPFRRIGHGQHDQPLVAGPDAQKPRGLIDFPQDRRVSQHPPRAGVRDQDDRGLIGSDRFHGGGPVRLPLAAGDQRLQAHAGRIVEIPQSLHVHDDHAAQRRARGAQAEDLVQLLLALHHGENGARLPQDGADPVRLRFRMDGHADRATPQNGEVGVDQFRPRLRQNRHRLPRPHSLGAQPLANGAGVTGEAGPGDGIPDPAIFLTQNDLRPVRRGVSAQQRGDGGVQFHSRLFFHRRWPRAPASFWPR